MNKRLANVEAQRVELKQDEDTLAELIKASVLGATLRPGAIDSVSAMLATREFRLQVLASIEDEINASLADLKAKEQNLRKRLS